MLKLNYFSSSRYIKFEELTIVLAFRKKHKLIVVRFQGKIYKNGELFL
jgi:hypothetical protein